MPNVHRAILRCSEQQTVRLGQVESPPIGDGDICVSMRFAGICGTDLDILRLHRPDLAYILGHEGVGVITDIGTNCRGWEVGQRVVFNPVNPRDQDDILGHSIMGVFQEKCVFTSSSVAAGRLVKAHPELSDLLAVIAEPLGATIYGHELVAIHGKPRSVAIFGAGPAGLLNAVYCIESLELNPILIHPHRRRLDWAVRHHLVQPENALLACQGVDQEILRLTKGRGVDAAFICTNRSGTLAAVSHALRAVRNGGFIDLLAGPNIDRAYEIPDVSLNAIRRANVCGNPQTGFYIRSAYGGAKWVHLTGHRGTSASHIKQAMAIITANAVSYEKLITHTVSLDKAPSVLQTLKNDRSGSYLGREVIKVVIDLRPRGL